MLEDAKREILTQVAKGKLDPDEAARRLEELERAATPPGVPPKAGASRDPSPQGPPLPREADRANSKSMA